jgi:YgiT-type zinc finger domain-containing protein
MGFEFPKEEATMRCVICKQGEIRPGTATVMLERNGMTLVVKSVPARVCENCGEEYVDEDVTARLLREAEDAARSGVQVDIREYVAA